MRVRRGRVALWVLGGLCGAFLLLALFWHPEAPMPEAAPASAPLASPAAITTPPAPVNDSVRGVELLAEARASCTHPSAARLRRLIHDYGLIWEDEALVRVTCHQVVIGMTAAQVRAAWGGPDHVNRTVTASGASEQWVYSGGTYLYLDNGRVTSAQTSR